MTEKFKDNLKEDDLKTLNNICEECEKQDQSVKENLILSGFKICNSCRVSKTVFPVQLIALAGIASIRLITKDIDKNAIIKKDKKTTPKDLKLGFRFNICLVDIISDAHIQN